MQTIAKPKKVKYEKGDHDNHEKVIIEPCFPGYGVTLGNSLRRVLLSSLSGAAVIGIKIKGGAHEFSALENMKEDVLQFVMNLKNLRIKVHSDEIIKLNLIVHGEKEIKAGDIEKNSEVEIMNKDLVLGKITDMSGNLEAEIFVKRGMGYETIKKREEKSKELGYIEIDSIFSPIILVGLKIENVRVGKMTNWEKLVIDIETDGTISAKEAFESSVKLLMDQFEVLLEGGEKEKATDKEEGIEKKAEKEEKKKKSDKKEAKK